MECLVTRADGSKNLESLRECTSVSKNYSVTSPSVGWNRVIDLLWPTRCSIAAEQLPPSK